VSDDSLPKRIINDLDGWVNDLAIPLMPPRAVPEGSNYVRLEFRQNIPHAVMVGKLVRAVSGIHAALTLVELGYIAECAAILRIVSDFCTEVLAIAEALNSGGVPPKAVKDFVDQYFKPKALTSEAYAALEGERYVSRNALLKAEVRLLERTNVDLEQHRINRDFLNMIFDAYVHGAYETTMDLF
jgi:hypothetical protein